MTCICDTVLVAVMNDEAYHRPFLGTTNSDNIILAEALKTSDIARNLVVTRVLATRAVYLDFLASEHVASSLSPQEADQDEVDDKIERVQTSKIKELLKLLTPIYSILCNVYKTPEMVLVGNHSAVVALDVPLSKSGLVPMEGLGTREDGEKN